MIIIKFPQETNSLKSANQLKKTRENLRTGIQIIRNVHVHTSTLSKSELSPMFSQKSCFARLSCGDTIYVSCGHVTRGHLSTDQCGLSYDLH